MAEGRRAGGAKTEGIIAAARIDNPHGELKVCMCFSFEGSIQWLTNI